MDTIDNAGLQYMHGRGFTDSTLKRYGVECLENEIVIHYPGTEYAATRNLSDGSARQYRKPAGKTEPLYNGAALEADIAFITEGQLDALSLLQAGADACAIGGAGGIHKLDGAKIERAVFVRDMDAAGEKCAEAVRDLLGNAGVPVMIAELPPGFKDSNDILREDPARLAELVKIWKQDAQKMPLKPGLQLNALEDVKQEFVNWLIPGYIPRGCVTLLIGDGGAGKTSIWCAIAAAVSAGKRPFLLTGSIPEDIYTADPERVLFFGQEDDVSIVLKKKLVDAGANQKNVFTMQLDDERMKKIKIGAPLLEKLIAEYRPGLCVLDPLQAFIPETVNMSARNEMRICMEPLLAWGKRYNTAFLIVVHTNKKTGVTGRNRAGESSDIWDISRSALVVGEYDDNGTRYITQSKNNYGALADTVLFRIEDGQPVFLEESELREKQIEGRRARAVRGTPAADEAAEMLLEQLADGMEREIGTLEGSLSSYGYSKNTIRRAKEQLRKAGKVKLFSRTAGYGTGSKWYLQLKE